MQQLERIGVGTAHHHNAQRLIQQLLDCQGIPRCKVSVDCLTSIKSALCCMFSL